MRTAFTRARVTRTIPVALLCGALALSLAGCIGTVKIGGPGGTGDASASDDAVEAAKAFEVSDVKMDKVAEGLPSVTVSGKLTNNGTKTYKAVLLTAELYKGGAEIDAPQEMVSGDAANDLKPGASQEFSVSFMAASADQDATMTKLLEADEARVVIEVATSFED